MKTCPQCNTELTRIVDPLGNVVDEFCMPCSHDGDTLPPPLPPDEEERLNNIIGALAAGGLFAKPAN